MHKANTHLHECQEKIIYVLLYCSLVCLSINYQLLVSPLLLYLNVEVSRYIWAVWKSGSQHKRVRRSIRVRNILSGVKLFASSGASEIWTKTATISCRCSLRWPPPELATSFRICGRRHGVYGPHELCQRSKSLQSVVDQCWRWSNHWKWPGDCTFAVPEVPLCRWKLNNDGGFTPPTPPPGSSGDLNSLKSTKSFVFFKCLDSAAFMNFCLQKCWRSALVAQEPWANCANQAASHIHATLMHCRIPPRPHLVRARYEEHHHGNRVCTYLKYLILTLKTEAEPRPDGPRNSTILASTSVRILSFLAMKLPSGKQT